MSIGNTRSPDILKIILRSVEKVIKVIKKELIDKEAKKDE